MTDMAVKDPDAKEKPAKDEEEGSTPPKRPRTSEDFYLFCKFVLEYENYEDTKEENIDQEPTASCDTPPLSFGSSDESTRADHTLDDTSLSSHNEAASSASSRDWIWKAIHMSEEDSYNVVTCFCKRPFAGRPMIECSKCLTWIHLSCAKIKKKKIPDVFICTKCKKNST